eukprot:7140397-Alexandrium_andersonii.AAC.1
MIATSDPVFASTDPDQKTLEGLNSHLHCQLIGPIGGPHQWVATGCILASAVDRLGWSAHVLAIPGDSSVQGKGRLSLIHISEPTRLALI